MHRTLTTCLVLSAVLTSPILATERVMTLEPGNTTVSFHLGATGHDVEGRMHLTAGEIRFDTEQGTASGKVEIDLKPTETGNPKRDKTMHKKVFETERFPLVVFEPNRFEGALPTSGSGEVEIFGTVAIHGSEHPLSMKAQFEIEGDQFEGTTTFAVPYVDWGLENPSMFVLRVAKNVDVTVKTNGSLH